jgi:hypothetical protein
LAFHHVVGEHQELVVHGGVVTLIRQQWSQAEGTIPISVFNWPWSIGGSQKNKVFRQHPFTKGHLALLNNSARVH